MTSKNGIYYFSHGMKVGYYTIREMGNCPVTRRDFDRYVCRLTTDPQSSLEKAQELGYTFTKAPDFSLEDIKRRSKAEMDAVRQAQAEEEARREAEIVAEIDKGVLPYGKYVGEAFADVPADYLKYIASTHDHLYDVLIAIYPDLFPEARIVDAYYGTVGEQYTENVLGLESFSFQGNFGWVGVNKVLVEATGEVLVYMGSGNFEVPVGSKATIKFKVKSHDLYQGKRQTKMLRPKVVS